MSCCPVNGNAYLSRLLWRFGGGGDGIRSSALGSWVLSVAAKIHDIWNAWGDGKYNELTYIKLGAAYYCGMCSARQIARCIKSKD